MNKTLKSFLVVATFAAFTASGAAIAPAGQSPPSPESGSGVWSFDMWCLEMEMYSEERCNQHRPSDLEDYVHYKADLELYLRQQSQQDQRDQELRNLINRDPTKAAQPSN